MSKINSAHRHGSVEDETEAARLGVSVGVDGRGLKNHRKKKPSVYSLGILAALRRTDTQEEPAA